MQFGRYSNYLSAKIYFFESWHNRLFHRKKDKEESETLSVFLDERNILPDGHKEKIIDSTHFIQNLTIREYKVYLMAHRRKWKDLDNRKIVSRV